jgi:chemotaxis signal transduction protein
MTSIDNTQQQQKRYIHDDEETWHFLVEEGLVLCCLLNAQTMLLDGDPVCSNDALLFRIDATYYAVPAQLVSDIQPLGVYTPVPFTQPCIIGVVNVQSHILSVFDVRSLLHHKHTKPHPNAVLLCIRLHHIDIGLMADSIVQTPHVLASHSTTSSFLLATNTYTTKATTIMRQLTPLFCHAAI